MTIFKRVGITISVVFRFLKKKRKTFKNLQLEEFQPSG